MTQSYITIFISLPGEYSCLKVTLLFKREFSYYLLTIYVPSCMLVIVSWISFWLDSKSVPARVSLGVTTLLTVSTQTAGVNRSLPPVAYTKVKYLLHPSPDRLYFFIQVFALIISSLEKRYRYPGRTRSARIYRYFSLVRYC